MSDLISRRAAIDALELQAKEMSRWAERYTEQAKGILTAKNIIEDMPTVEAIPYEFLRELAKNQPHCILTVWDFLPRVIENIIEVWEEWEKENETN